MTGGSLMCPVYHEEGPHVASLVLCRVMVSVFLSLQLLPCCRESNSVRLVGEGPWAVCVSDGAKPVANRSAKGGATAWQIKGCRGKGCAVTCLGNVSVPEMDGHRGAGCKAQCSLTQPRDWTWSQVCLGKCPQDGTWCREPRAVRARLAFSWAGLKCLCW